MPTQAQVQSQRKAALREVRRRERALDSQIERVERRLFVLLDRKSLVTPESVISLANLWSEYQRLNKAMEQGLIDLFTIVSQ